MTTTMTTAETKTAKAMIVALFALAACVTRTQDSDAGSPDGGSVDGGADASVAACLASPVSACPAPCFVQQGRLLADAGTCGYDVPLYCGARATSGTHDVKCWMRASDGLIVRVPSLVTLEPPGLFRPCTGDEARATDGPYHVLCP